MFSLMPMERSALWYTFNCMQRIHGSRQSVVLFQRRCAKISDHCRGIHESIHEIRHAAKIESDGGKNNVNKMIKRKLCDNVSVCAHCPIARTPCLENNNAENNNKMVWKQRKICRLRNYSSYLCRLVYLDSEAVQWEARTCVDYYLSHSLEIKRNESLYAYISRGRDINIWKFNHGQVRILGAFKPLMTGATKVSITNISPTAIER